MGSGMSSSFGTNTELSKAAAKSIVDAAAREKKDMQALNERLGNYIDRVKGLEDKNHQLVDELNNMRGSWGSDTRDAKVGHPYTSFQRTGLDQIHRRIVHHPQRHGRGGQSTC
jgi:hypothetical protein